MKKYAIVVERAERNYAAYVPDLPGCVATGATVEETERRLREAIELHVAGMREDGLEVPDPSSVVDYLEIAAEPIATAGRPPPSSSRRG
jgi:predicted RNase H-like HicB family nuclease